MQVRTAAAAKARAGRCNRQTGVGAAVTDAPCSHRSLPASLCPPFRKWMFGLVGWKRLVRKRLCLDDPAAKISGSSTFIARAIGFASSLSELLWHYLQAVWPSLQTVAVSHNGQHIPTHFVCLLAVIWPVWGFARPIPLTIYIRSAAAQNRCVRAQLFRMLWIYQFARDLITDNMEDPKARDKAWHKHIEDRFREAKKLCAPYLPEAAQVLRLGLRYLPVRVLLVEAEQGLAGNTQHSSQLLLCSKSDLDQPTRPWGFWQRDAANAKYFIDSDPAVQKLPGRRQSMDR